MSSCPRVHNYCSCSAFNTGPQNSSLRRILLFPRRSPDVAVRLQTTRRHQRRYYNAGISVGQHLSRSRVCRGLLNWRERMDPVDLVKWDARFDPRSFGAPASPASPLDQVSSYEIGIDKLWYPDLSEHLARRPTPEQYRW
jgi:hypothetical protein